MLCLCSVHTVIYLSEIPNTVSWSKFCLLVRRVVEPVCPGQRAEPGYSARLLRLAMDPVAVHFYIITSSVIFWSLASHDSDKL